jgi:Rap1a immunity proteins
MSDRGKKALLLTASAIAGVILTSASMGADTTPLDLAALQAKDPTTSIHSLYEACTGADFSGRNFCTGYIVGVAESLGQLSLNKSTRSSGICWTGQTIEFSASVQVFKNWAQKHPEAWGVSRYAGVMWALKETWPCK